MDRVVLCTALCALLSTHAPAAAPPAEPDMRRPLDWLIAAQNDDGSWGDGAKDPHPDVATTALAGLALLRLGHTGSRGEHQEHTRRAVSYVAAAVERAPQDEIAINAPGTLPQRKLGRNIDTFVAQADAPASPELKRRAEEARKAGTVQLSNESVLRGFGSYGGEEHVSYMLTAEAKAALGGSEWT